jgi:hypothetical protein
MGAPHVFTSTSSATSTTSTSSTSSTSSNIRIISAASTTACLLTKREERPRQRGHKGEVLATMSAGIAIFRFSTKSCAIWPNFYQHPMQFNLFPTSAKFRLTWVGVKSLQCPQKLRIGWGSSPYSAICCRGSSTHAVG